MKNFKSTVYLFLVLATMSLNAQSKVAHINTQELIALMPEMKAAKIEFDKLQESLGADIQDKVTEYKNKLTLYTNEAPNKTAIENEARQKELAELETKIRETEANAQATSEQKYTELTTPIQEKALAVIQKVGRAKGFEYVLDSTSGSGVLLMDGTDLMAAVKKELGIN